VQNILKYEQTQTMMDRNVKADHVKGRVKVRGESK
jgi:hypothetical protein